MDSQQAGTVSLEAHSELTFAICHGPIITLSPLTPSPCPECNVQPETSALVDCCSCVYSLVGFLFMNMGWEKYSDLSLGRGGA